MNVSSNLIRNIASVALVTLMVLLTDLSGNKEFIFPETGALCVGLWIVNKHVWRALKWQIPVIFTIAAIVGVCIVRYMPYPFWAQVETGFFAVAVLLMVFDASITPAISACLLPVLIGTNSWLYPTVVFVLTAILSVGQWVMERKHLRDVVDENPSFSIPSSRVKLFVRWLIMMVLIAPILFVATKYEIPCVVVPPLIVTFVEFSNSASGFRNRPMFIYMTLFAAAILGDLAESGLHELCGLPQCVCAMVSVAAILYCFNRMDKFFAPAVAIVLLPMIISKEQVAWYVFYVAAGAFYFIFVANIFFGGFIKNVLRTNKEENQ